MNRNTNRWVNSGSFIMILLLLVPVAAHAGDAQQALNWLGSHQRADGAWCGTEESYCAAVTAEVVSTLVPMAAQAPVAATLTNRALPVEVCLVSRPAPDHPQDSHGRAVVYWLQLQR